MNINNIPTTHKRFIVAFELDHEMWYHGSWDDEQTAYEMAQRVRAERGWCEVDVVDTL